MAGYLTKMETFFLIYPTGSFFENLIDQLTVCDQMSANNLDSILILHACISAGQQKFPNTRSKHPK